MPTWYEAKRIANLIKHNIDFSELNAVFEQLMLTQEDTRYGYDRVRLQSLAWFKGRVVYLVWAEDEDDVHVISCRYASAHETQYYLQIFYSG